MPKVVALHGFTGSGQDFGPLQAALGPSFEILAPDFPGHGTKVHLRQKEDYSLDAHLKTISDVVQNDTVTLLGYSMGGRLALHWALKNPSQIQRLILIGASPGLASTEEQNERIRGDCALAHFIRTQGLDAFFKYWNTKTFFQPLLALNPATLDPILQRRQRNQPEALALSLENVGTGALPSLWHRLPECRFPVDLIVGGHDDKFIKIAYRMGEKIPRSRISLIENCGHSVHLESPEDIATLLQSTATGK